MALAILLTGAAGNSRAEPRDCNGFTVTDSVEFDPNLQWRLDTASDAKLFEIYIRFQSRDPVMPDSCHLVYCPDVDYTYMGRLFKTWSQRLFTDYEIFAPRDTLHRLMPDELEASAGYNHIWARKSTILALSKECYIWQVSMAQYLASTRPSASISPSEKANSHVDALGRKPDSRELSIGAKISTPAFAPKLE